MKEILLLLICCLVLHNGKGAPRNAVYKFVKCNPEGDQANCVTHQTPVMAWSQDLPSKLPSTTAQYLEAEVVEDEQAPKEDYEEEQMEEDEKPMPSDEGESPGKFPPEESSGFSEGSAFEGPYSIDPPFVATERDTGSGAWRDVDVNKGGNTTAMRRLLLGRSEAKPAEEELREDDLLQL